jgi:phosphoglycolate phosphatase
MRGLVFDFDGPLFEGRSAARQALTATAEHFRDRFSLDVAMFDRLPLLRPRPLLQLVSSEIDLDRAQLDEIEAVYRQRLAEAEDAVKARPEITRLLRTLKERDVPVGVLSSRRQEDVRRRLKQLGLDRLVQACHGRDSLKKAKPDPDALLQIAGELAVKPAELIFVGDSGDDFLCAQAAKVTYYHIGWSGEPVPHTIHAAAVTFESPPDLAEALLARTPEVQALDRQSLPKDLVTAIENRDLVFYAGSGVSVPSGIGDWQGHYRKVFQELGAGYLVEDGMDLPELLQLLAAQDEMTKQLFDRFRESFDRPDIKPSAYHFAMLRAQPARIWTTNYDRLFEKANSACGFGCHIATDDRSLLEHFRSNKLIVKMNGDFDTATYDDSLDWNLIFTQEQFDLVERQRPEIWRLFEDDYRNRCIVFVGASFRDPALRRIVALARRRIPRTRYSHFLLARQAVQPVEQRKEYLQATNLRRQSIHTFFFREFSSITQFVCDIAIQARRPIIGFSGSFRRPEGEAADDSQKLPGGSLTASGIEKLGGSLGEALAGKGFRVTSGCSPVVGIPPVSAAFGVAPDRARFYLRSRGGTYYSGTAPAIVVSETSGPAGIYDAMRERFVSELSLLIAYGGTPPAEGRTSGTVAEIERALDLGIPVLIIPQAGGHVAAYRPTLLQAIDRSYSDRALARQVRLLNEEIATVAAENLNDYARGELPEGIDELMRVLFRCSVPVGNRESASTDW